MIKIANAEKALESLITGDEEYYELEFQSSTEHPDGSTEIEFSMSQAPRELSELISWEGADTLQEVDITNIDSEDASNSAFRSLTGKLDADTLENMNIEADEPVFAVFFGSTSAGEYCDDETDAYISGTLILGPKSTEESAIEKANRFMVSEIDGCAAKLVKAASHNLTLLANFGGKASKTMRDNIVDLNRNAVR